MLTQYYLPAQPLPSSWLSSDITKESQGAIIISFGRTQTRNLKENIYQAMEEGRGKYLWEWCEKKTKDHERSRRLGQSPSFH